MATVLITGAGGATGITVIRSLQTETSHETVGVDMNPAAAGIQLAEFGTTVPAAGDQNWPNAIAETVDCFDVDVIVPTVDEELSELSDLSEAVSSEVPIVAPKQTVINIALDKYSTYKRLDDAGHRVPQTWLASEAGRIDLAAFPLIVKPRQGRGSRGVQRVENTAELEKYIAETNYSRESLICQEFISGAEYTTSVVGTRDNRLLGVVPKEAIEKDGSTTVGVTREAPAVAASCRKIFETLQPAGPMNVQQIVDEDGDPHTIEINPRFSSTSCLTVAAGVDEFDLLIRDALGESVTETAQYVPGRYILRYTDHIFVDTDTLDHLTQEITNESEGRSIDPRTTL
jgi:carbamoyl-phosphate synthase large subunit